MESLPSHVRRLRSQLGASQRGIRDSLSTAPRSSHFNGHRFRNAEPEAGLSVGQMLGMLPSYLAADKTGKKPSAPVPLMRPDFPDTASELAVTWLGHASVLIEIDGYRVLADPVFSDRVSPTQWVGPRRLHSVPVRLDELPTLDAVVISHDHYDHLDQATIMTLVGSTEADFLVPLGVGAHLRSWGVPAARTVELDWDGQHHIGTLTITCTPARHFSGRTTARNATLWSSWSLVGPTKRVFFGGDTGYTPAFAEIGASYGPFDLCVLPIGAYDTAWSEIHMNPEEAVRACGDLGGGVLLPIHWATFDLARHDWSEPIERLLAASGGEALALPVPGQRLVLGELPSQQKWWRGAAE
ncbi:MAG: MBL fold metallo-hydrolase [Nakamurella sp.]